MARVLRMVVRRTGDSLATEEILRVAAIVAVALFLRALIGLL
jgi:hypothetical protein